MDVEIRRVAELKGGKEVYLPIRMKKGAICQGGDQAWLDSLPHMREQGCGVIAMNDLEAYLCRENSEYTLPKCERNRKRDKSEGAKSNAEILSAELSATFRQTELSQEVYEKMVEYNWQRSYHIGKDPISLLVGLFPWNMERGLREFFECNGLKRKIKWAPHWKKHQKTQRKLVLKQIREMLEKGFPVVCAYHTFDSVNQTLALYSKASDAIAGQVSPGGKTAGINSHYMTIIGLYSYSTNEKEQYLLKLVSWGRIYYVSYSDYAARLNLFTNILWVE